MHDRHVVGMDALPTGQPIELGDGEPDVKGPSPKGGLVTPGRSKHHHATPFKILSWICKALSWVCKILSWVCDRLDRWDPLCRPTLATRPCRYHPDYRVSDR